ncbi:F-box domain-containing protein [Caenorhabditis elegans]|uniref:F-box domain-containing protein n=1 Tax=Caenorhabditis elegans TaxID=6239 RepID=Q564T6_CAEEL|nr:F-box domain-containing protein [Caenorhabditis elegans]CAB04470.2 F-box domain-containing protein [Caenorhabditis elegans]|eukprot:NP_001023984.2 F-box B protein [Caenorhabditis elegans]
MTTTTSFPILHLPAKSLKHAICCLTPEEIIKFSLVSKSTKRAAESLNLEQDIYSIDIDEIVSVNVECDLIKWNPLEVDLRTLIDHIQCVFHTNEVSHLLISNDNHDWKSIHKALDGVNCSRTSLEVHSQNIWLQRIVNQFSSCFLQLFLSKSTWYHPILSAHRIQLNLLIPSTDFSCEHLHVNQKMSSRDLNLFLKRWMRGEYKSLKSLRCHVGSEASADEIFKDVKYKEENVKSVIQWNWGFMKVKRVIYRFDGTRATCVLKYGYVTFDVLK